MNGSRRSAGPGTDIDSICDRLGYTFTDPTLLTHALTHRSWCAENAGRTSNERLEFLGDAVLGMTIAEFAYREYPDHAEGELAKIRAGVVNAQALVDVARALDIGPHVYLGKGERASGGSDKPSILSDAMEAVLGAVFLDGGWEVTRDLIIELFAEMVQVASVGPGSEDHKTLLQEYAAQRFAEPPAYTITEDGPDHAKVFSATVSLDDEPVGSGTGGSKKEAEQAAAGMAWRNVTSRHDASAADNSVLAASDSASAAENSASAAENSATGPEFAHTEPNPTSTSQDAVDQESAPAGAKP